MQILPSGQQPPPGLTLSPFRGLRYVQDRVSGLAEVTSPPYDVITSETAEELLASDPHNVVRLILPRHDEADAPGAYTDAARLLRSWQEQGILLPDPEPALYVYEQGQHVYEQGQPDGEVIQRGLIGALCLSPPDAGYVLPHEDVMPGPVIGRRQLTEATEANLEPIFLIYGGGRQSAATQLVADVTEHREPLLTVDTGDGMRHRLWAVTDRAEHALVAADLASRQAMIADGHHRYAAYLQVQQHNRAAGKGAGPWDSALALLVDSSAFPPRIGGIHRVIPGLAPGDAVQRAQAGFTVRALPTAGPASALDALHRASRDTTAFLVAGGGRVWLLTDPDPAEVAAATPGRSDRWRRLSASVLQELLLGRLWNIPDDEHRVLIHHDALEALRAVARVGGGTAVICPPLSAGDVQEIAAHGERVPRKSTSFAPKPRTGLVMRSFAHS